MFVGRHWISGALLALLLTGCSSTGELSMENVPIVGGRAASSSQEQAAASVPGIPGARFHGDAPPTEAANMLGDLAQGEAARRNLEVTYLALSGGGADGAFGAGMLSGWSAGGGRPEFTIVSGVSTGALIAPFAFLGSAYDRQLEAVYTGDFAQKLLRPNAGYMGAVLGGSVYQSQPLRDMIARSVDTRFLAAVAEEHRRGRRLLVVTTNIDSQRTTVWNMGEIAASGQPHALQLFRDILAASASIPGVFPAVPIEVQSGNRRFKELHVDGGVTTQVYVMPQQALLEAGTLKNTRMFVMINNKLGDDFRSVKNGTLSLANRAVSTMIKTHTEQSLMLAYVFARQRGIDFNVAYITDGWESKGAVDFDQRYMRDLFDYGHRRGKSISPWDKAPPNAGAHDLSTKSAAPAATVTPVATPAPPPS